MNLKILNRTELDLRIKSLAQKERDLLHEVLLTIKEIDCRRAYLDLGFGSLFDYLVQGVGYSEGSAQRRIDAARLVREIPELAIKIQNGEIKLNQISLVQKAARQVLKSQAKIVTSHEKMDLLNKISQNDHSTSQQQVAAYFDLPALQFTQLKTQADESVRVEMTLTKEAHEKIKKAQELLSHAVSTQDIAAFLEYLAEKVIIQKTRINQPALKAKTLDNSGSTSTSTSTSTPSMVVPASPKTSLSTATVAVTNGNKQAALKDMRQVRGKQGCCQYVDQKSGRQCQSTWKLQIDHKQSRWSGGGHTIENLQLLCAGHNRLKYRMEAGLRFLG